MITITNGQMTLVVPNSAFHTLYEPSGFRPLEDEERAVSSEVTFIASEEKAPEIHALDLEEENTEETEEAEEEIDLSEIPLSEMDFYQLCAYADQLGLDRSGLRSKKELRALIRQNL